MTRNVLSRVLRRARLLAARSRDFRSVTRRGVLSGQWDGGNVVRGFLSEFNGPMVPARRSGKTAPD